MQSKNYLQSKMPLLGVFSLALLLGSCGSYQYAGQDEDAIYGDSEKRVEYVEQSKSDDNASEDSGYYKNYFREKTEQFDNINQDDVIFTDIDSYEGSYDQENDSINEEYYAGWGEDHNDDVTINIYGGHLYNSIWWNRPYYYGGFGFGYGYGFGYDYYNPFWCPPYYGSFYYAYRPWWYGGYYYYSPYGYGHYGNSYYGYYNRRAVAYNASRRNPANSNNSVANLVRRNSINNTAARRNSNNRARPNTNARTRPNTTQRGRPNTTQRGRPNTNSSVKGRPNTTQRGRPNTSSRPKGTVKPRGNTRTRPTTTRPTSKRRKNNSSYNSRPTSSSRSSSYSRSSSTRRSSGSRTSSRRSGGSSKRGGQQ